MQVTLFVLTGQLSCASEDEINFSHISFRHGTNTSRSFATYKGKFCINCEFNQIKSMVNVYLNYFSFQ